MFYVGGLGYRNKVGGGASVRYRGAVTVAAAAAAALHLPFGLEMKIVRALETTASLRTGHGTPLGKSHVGSAALTTRLALLYNSGWPTLLIGLAQKGSRG